MRGPVPVEADKAVGHTGGYGVGPPIVLPKMEHGALGQYLREVLDVEEPDMKATSFMISFKCYKLAMELHEKLNQKGWKVKRKDWEWIIPRGKIVFIFIDKHRHRLTSGDRE